MLTLKADLRTQNDNVQSLVASLMSDVPSSWHLLAQVSLITKAISLSTAHNIIPDLKSIKEIK